MAKALMALAALVLMLGVGCAAKEEKPAWGPSEEWRLRSLEENFLSFKETFRAQQDEFGRREERLANRMLEIEGQVEDMSRDVAGMHEAQIEQAGVLADLRNGIVQGGSTSPEARPWAEMPTAEPEPEPAAKPAPRAKASKATGQADYDQGLALYRAGKPKQAREKLNAFLEADPQGKLAPNALYWIGETHYDQKDFPQAVMTFKEVARRFPQNPKAPAAIYKIALSYEKLGDASNAIFYLQALLDDYPKSDPAGPARAKLKQLGG